MFGMQEFYFLGFHFNYFDFSFKIEKYKNFIRIIWVALLVKDMKLIRYKLMIDSSPIGVLFDLVLRQEISTKFINLIHHTLR